MDPGSKREVVHYGEDEILLHVLGETAGEAHSALAAHLRSCRECGAVARDLASLQARLREWEVPEPSAGAWAANRTAVFARIAQIREEAGSSGIAAFFGNAWSYALSNPLPTLGYIAAAVAFASERTITVFRLDEILPPATEVVQILRQVL